jgi:hypothetical protein
MPDVGNSWLLRVSSVMLGRRLLVSPSLNRFARGSFLNTLTELAVPKNVDVVEVEISSFWTVYVSAARSSGWMIG